MKTSDESKDPAESKSSHKSVNIDDTVLARV